MSSYRSNYGRYGGSTASSGLGTSSYSPASSTSSLASTASTSGSATSKYSSSLTSSAGLKSSDSTPSRESSFTSSLSTPSSGRLSRFSSSLSSRGDAATSSTTGGTSSSLTFGANKSSASSSYRSTSKEKATTTGTTNVYGLSSLSSKYSSSNANDSTSSPSSFRTNSYSRASDASASSANSLSRDTASSSLTKDSILSKPKTPLLDARKLYTSSLQNSTTKESPKEVSDSPSSTNTASTGLTSGYRPYSSRTLAGTPDVLNSSSVSSALRTTARFGLRSGTSHAIYSSSLPTASTLKAAAKLAEETKKEMNKKESADKLARLAENDSSAVSWISRGTCTFLDVLSSKIYSPDDDDEEEDDAGEVSCKEVPPFEPRIFSSRYDGVLKHKGIQTDEEAKPKLLQPSAIPRPSVSMNYYNTYGTAMNRFNSAKTNNANAQQGETCSNGDTAESPEKSSSSSIGSSSINNNSRNKTPGTMTSGSDQSSRSPHQTNVAESFGNCNNGEETTSSASTTTTTTNSSPRGGATSLTNKATSPTGPATTSTDTASPSSSGFVISVANKEFRKSALNVGLNSKDAEIEFAKKQEELRMKKSPEDTSTHVINNNSSDNQTNSPTRSISNSPSLLSNTKRDPPSRPPTDAPISSISTKSSSPTRSLLHSKSINKMPQSESPSATSNNTLSSSDVSSAEGAAAAAVATGSSAAVGLIKMKSTKSITSQLRKLSTASSNASDCESTSSGSSTPSTAPSTPVISTKLNPTTTKVKKKILTNGSNNSLDKAGGGLGRRGSVTQNSNNSSGVSSRSNSVERTAQNNNCNNHHNDHNNQLMNGSTSVKVEKGSGIGNLTVNKPPSGSLSSAGKERTKTTMTTPASSLTTKPKALSPSSSPKNSLREPSPPSPSSQVAPTRKSPPKPSSPPKDQAPNKSADTVQTSFLLRTLESDKPWVRKCQSGELPWWLTSSPDVPSILGKSPSKTLFRDPTLKDLDVQEEPVGGRRLNHVTRKDEDQDSSSSEMSDASDLDEDLILSPTQDGSTKRVLGERTSPDGIEVTPTLLVEESVTAVLPTKVKGTLKCASRKGSLDSSQDRNKPKSGQERKNSLFISNLTNIDDILGTVSPALIPNSPSPAPINFSEAELCEAQRKMSLKDEDDFSDDDSSSDSSSSTSEVVMDELDRNERLYGTKGSDDEEEVLSDDDGSTGTSSSFEEVDPSSLKIPAPAQQSSLIDSPGSKKDTVSCDAEEMIPKKQQQTLDDATLQLYRDGECGTYLDLESSISEQQEEFDGFHSNRKNSIVLRAQLSVRVHAIIEKLLTADGRELRRALFSLKQIFQEDKDLVHEFVENGGLSCLIKVGSEADQNYQNYILRAIGQVMLYVDGMYGVMRHNETIQWLYTLVASKFRLVQKTALKLLLVFVDYVETNCLLLVEAVAAVDTIKGLEPWANIMTLLGEHDSNSGDTELLVYAMSLVNKVLNGIPDIDTYYDQVDALEEQGMATVIQSYMGKQCADLDLLKQFQIYELVLKHEDGEEDNIMMQLDETMRTKLLNRKGYNDSDSHKERRKSRRHSTSTPPTTPNGSVPPNFPRRLSSADVTPRDSPFSSLSSSSSIGTTNGSPTIMNGHSKEKDLTPGLRRRRERADHQKNLILEQLVNGDSPESPTDTPNSPSSLIPLGRSQSSKKDISSLEQQNNLKNNTSNMNGSCNGNNANGANNAARPWMLPIYTKNGTSGSSTNIPNGVCKGEKENGDCSESEKAMQVKKENTVKDLTQKLASQNLLASPAEENKSFINTGELSGVVSKAKEGLAKSKSRADMLKPPSENNANGNNKGLQIEVKKSDNELHWDFLVNNLQRPLEICDLDFTDLKNSDDEDILAPDPAHMNGGFGLPPPFPCMMTNGSGPPPPPPGVGKFGGAPPPPLNGLALSSPLFGVNLKNQNSGNSNSSSDASKANAKKTKKTVKLFWKEVREDPITASKVEKVGCIWSEINPIQVDTQRLEHLFESRAKDIINKKQSDVNKSKEIVVLDPKRSNAINIGMTKLPPPRTIKAAIMKMDSTIINREGIEKLLTMLPTEEERAKITEAQFANPETPLGSAEQFLLTLSSISELTARLKLWAFKLDYDNLEREVAEPLMDLKTGISVLEKNKTFRYILATLLSIGNFLNGAEAKGFQIEYLSKVPEVKDTVQKHSLLHHLCQTVNENHPDSTDLYSEIGPVTRASRVDFDEISTNLQKMESECKTSWDHLRVIAKHDGPTNLKLKLSEFLADCAERIIVLGMIHRRIVNRFRKFLLWLGVPAHQVTTTKPHTLFKIVSEFALEYRTTRERVIQQLQKKANHRERNKTRGKMITEQPQQIMYKSKEDQEDAELREVLSKTTTNGNEPDALRGAPLAWRRQKSQPNGSTPSTPTGTLYHNFQNNKNSSLNGSLSVTDGDDEILESLVKTATRTSDTRVATRERKRINGAPRNYSTERKSLRRTLRHGLTEEERKMLATFMANGHSFY